MSDKWPAPWTDEQIEALKKRQGSQALHPYTCGNNSNHGLLVPTEQGWVCPDCDYTQNWAHDESYFKDHESLDSYCTTCWGRGCANCMPEDDIREDK